ncbi:hypothetical protein DMENIID0001_084180 [Sergentomyia squamirostris]
MEDVYGSQKITSIGGFIFLSTQHEESNLISVEELAFTRILHTAKHFLCPALSIAVHLTSSMLNGFHSVHPSLSLSGGWATTIPPSVGVEILGNSNIYSEVYRKILDLFYHRTSKGSHVQHFRAVFLVQRYGR